MRRRSRRRRARRRTPRRPTPRRRRRTILPGTCRWSRCRRRPARRAGRRWRREVGAKPRRPGSVSADTGGARRARPTTIMLISDRRLRPIEELWDDLPQAARAGLTDLMIREKDLPGGPLLALVRQAIAHARPEGIRMTGNDRADVP